MPVLDHTIVTAHDHQGSASFVAELLGLPAPATLGHFAVVQVGEVTTLDFVQIDGPVKSQHYAFLVTEEEFDEIFGRITDRASRTGPTRGATSPGGSTRGTADVGSTSTTPTAISSRSSRGRTVPAAQPPATRTHSSPRARDGVPMIPVLAAETAAMAAVSAAEISFRGWRSCAHRRWPDRCRCRHRTCRCLSRH
jgi:hypothetical protein